MTTTFCGHDFVEYSILYHFTFSYPYVDDAPESDPSPTNRSGDHEALIAAGLHLRAYLPIGADPADIGQQASGFALNIGPHVPRVRLDQ